MGFVVVSHLHHLSRLVRGANCRFAEEQQSKQHYLKASTQGVHLWHQGHLFDSLQHRMLNFHLNLTVLMLMRYSYSVVVQPVGFAVAVRIESQSPAVVVVEFVELNSAGFAPAVAVPEVSIEGSNSAAKLLVVEVYFVVRH